MKLRTQPAVLANCLKIVDFFSDGNVRHALYSFLLQNITKPLHFSYLKDILIGKNYVFRAVGKCSNVVCEVSCWRKEITIGILATPARTANKFVLMPSGCRASCSIRNYVRSISFFIYLRVGY